MRACFATPSSEWSLSRAAVRMRRLRGTSAASSQKKRANPQARATSAVADALGAATNYVQKVRGAVADLISQKQGGLLKAAAPCQHVVLGILLDEAEQSVSIRRTLKQAFRNKRKIVHVSQLMPALVVHSCITFANIGQPAFTCEWLLPMLALAFKASGCMLSAVKQQMQDAVQEVKQKGTSWTLLLISDWAKTNRRLFREMVQLLSATFAIHSKCIMHKVSQAIGGARVGGVTQPTPTTTATTTTTPVNFRLAPEVYGHAGHLRKHHVLFAFWRRFLVDNC